MVECKNCGHPYCEHAGTQRGIVVSCYNYLPQQKPPSNADRIRAMSDEELAVFLYDEGEVICKDQRVCSEYGCKDCILDWLRQPTDGGDT